MLPVATSAPAAFKVHWSKRKAPGLHSTSNPSRPSKPGGTGYHRMLQVKSRQVVAKFNVPCALFPYLPRLVLSRPGPAGHAEAETSETQRDTRVSNVVVLGKCSFFPGASKWPDGCCRGLFQCAVRISGTLRRALALGVLAQLQTSNASAKSGSQGWAQHRREALFSGIFIRHGTRSDVSKPGAAAFRVKLCSLYLTSQRVYA